LIAFVLAELPLFQPKLDSLSTFVEMAHEFPRRVLLLYDPEATDRYLLGAYEKIHRDMKTSFIFGECTVSQSELPRLASLTVNRLPALVVSVAETKRVITYKGSFNDGAAIRDFLEHFEEQQVPSEAGLLCARVCV